MPDAACLDVWAKTLAYIAKKTEGFSGSYVSVLQSPAYKAADEALNTAILAGDLVHTKQSCKAIWTLVFAHTTAAKPVSIS